MKVSSPLQLLLLPVSWIYGLGVWLRNFGFDHGLIGSRRYDLPVICVGNLAVGGTGKTPHAEYLVKLLQQNGKNVAVLSRGYKRRTRGYLLADARSRSMDIGDEPYQLKQKFSDLTVAVDERRQEGIERLMQLNAPPMDAIMLDDAFQHRYVRAGLNIIITDYNKLYVDDLLLPAGRLREPSSGAQRAQAIIVSKCPQDLTISLSEEISRRLRLLPHQQIYFSTLTYGSIYGLWGNAPLSLKPDDNVLLLTGIANPAPLAEYLDKVAKVVDKISFPDHHAFSEADADLIASHFHAIKAKAKYIITTQKDAARLMDCPYFDEEIRKAVFVQPVEIKILLDRQEAFDNMILEYVDRDARVL